MDHGVCAVGPTIVAFIPHKMIMEAFNRTPSLGFAMWRETLIDAAIFREAITNSASSTRPTFTPEILLTSRRDIRISAARHLGSSICGQRSAGNAWVGAAGKVAPRGRPGHRVAGQAQSRTAVQPDFADWTAYTATPLEEVHDQRALFPVSRTQSRMPEGSLRPFAAAALKTTGGIAVLR